MMMKTAAGTFRHFDTGHEWRHSKYCTLQ